MLEAGLVPGSVVEGFDVVEQDRAEFGAGDVFPVAVDVADLAFECRPGSARRMTDACGERSNGVKGCDRLQKR